MKQVYTPRSLFSAIALPLMLWATLSTSLSVQAAAPLHEHVLQKGAVAAKKLPHTQQRHLPANAPRQVRGAPIHNQLIKPAAIAHPATTTDTCPSTLSIRLKVLVIASDGTEVDLPAITQALDYQGTPYDVYKAALTPGGLTSTMLQTDACHGLYEGIILTDGLLVYNNNGNWVSALSQQEWTTLWSYEASMHIRQLNWYTYPSADFGFQVPTGAVDTTTSPIAATLTTQGKSIFTYLNPNVTITIQYAYTYLAQPLTDGTTTPVLTDAQGNALAALHSYVDGRLALTLTFDSNQYLLHDIALSYGLINWITNGLYLGEHHVAMSAQPDDMFIDDDIWTPTTPCGTPVEQTGASYRITGSDLQTFVNWQNQIRVSSPVTAGTTITMPFNGYGTVTGVYPNDTLTPVAVANRYQFYWVSHTYDHENLDNVTYGQAYSELSKNINIAQKLQLGSRFTTQAMVTPDVSGLKNANFLKAAHDLGIRYLVSDTSVSGYANPAPNVGIRNPLQPDILMLPRYPTNLFYNVSMPQEWVAEYNCLYASFWGRPLSYSDILDKESQTLLTYLLKGDLDPWMFHQPNLRAYDGVHSLLGDLLTLTMNKYKSYYTLPIINPPMQTLGSITDQFMKYKLAGATATIIPGVSITISVQTQATIPVTGVKTTGAELYGGQYISYVNVVPGQPVTLPLQ